MANLQVITTPEFAKKSWRRKADYSHSARDATCPLAVSELPRAMMGMPIAFINNEGTFSIVAVLGLEKDTNFFLNADGQWMAEYVPAAYRGYPFVLAKNPAEDNKLVLCIDKDSGQLVEDTSAEPFFDKDGELYPALKNLLDLLSQLQADLQMTARICDSLRAHDLFTPWELQIELDSGAKKRINGLFRIDEDAFNALSNESFCELRQSGVLPAIYCQLLSMQKVTILMKLARTRSTNGTTSLPMELDLDGISTDGNINFDNF